MDPKLLTGTKIIRSSVTQYCSSLGLLHYLLALIFSAQRRIYTYNTSFSVVVRDVIPWDYKQHGSICSSRKVTIVQPRKNSLPKHHNRSLCTSNCFAALN